MDQIGQEQHPDVAAEVTQRTGQGLAVLATLAEATARLAAEEMRRRQRQEEELESAHRKQDAAQARLRREAEKLKQRAQRHRDADNRNLIRRARDPRWVAGADLLDLAQVWRAAATAEQRFADPAATAAAEVIEERLRQMYPHPMRGYDQARAAGASRATAMRPAAEQMAQTPVMRAHGGRRTAALNAPPAPVGGEVFAASLTDERIRMATGVDIASYESYLRRLGIAGAVAAEALRKALATRAAQEITQAQHDAATPDDPSTPGVDEHLSVGVPSSTGDRNAADRDAAASGAVVAAQWYPYGLNHVAPAQEASVAGPSPKPAASMPQRAVGRVQ